MKILINGFVANTKLFLLQCNQTIYLFLFEKKTHIYKKNEIKNVSFLFLSLSMRKSTNQKTNIKIPHQIK